MLVTVVGACERRQAVEGTAPAHASPAEGPVSASSSPLPIRASASALATTERVDAKSAKRVVPREVFSWDFERTPLGRMRAWVVVPKHREGERMPVLIALHGRGESLKGVDRGARGWLDDYGLLKAFDRLEKPPLLSRDFEGLVTKERLSAINRSLRKEPYQHVIVVTPYTPTSLGGEAGLSNAEVLAQFFADDLLKRVSKLTSAQTKPSAVGIDGVSLGGRAALLAGLSRPEAFGAVSALQAAFDVTELDEVAARAQAALRKNPYLKLRLVTSEDDYYLRENRVLSQKFGQLGVEHEFLVVPGPHDYEFNRGPGVYEMLLYHARVLRGRDSL